MGQAARGFIWLTLQTLTQRALTLGSQLVLAWLLEPSDFGAAGLALTVVTIINSGVGLGLDDVLVQRGSRAGLWSKAATRWSIATGVGALLITWLLTPLSAVIFHSRLSAELIFVGALTFPINALSIVPMARLRSSLRFRELGLVGVLETVITVFGGVALAALGGGAVSLVLPGVISAAVRVVILWRASKDSAESAYRPGQGAKLISRSTYVVGHRIVTTLIGQGDYLVIGMLLTPVDVGYYYFAFRLAVQPIFLLAGNMQNVLFPMLIISAKNMIVGDEISTIVAEVLNFAVFPVCFAQAACAKYIIIAFFGPKWADSIHIIEVLSIGLGFEVATRVPGSLMNSRGQFKRTLFYTIAPAPVFFGCIIIGAKMFGTIGVASGVTIYYILSGPLWLYFSYSERARALSNTLKVYVLPITLSALSSYAGWQILNLYDLRYPALGLAVAEAVIIMVLYAGLIWLIRPASLQRAFEQFRASRSAG